MNTTIRVLHVVAKMNRAGTETMIMNLYRNIDRSKVQFDFAVCTKDKCDYEDEILSLGGQIYRYPRYIVSNHISYCKWWNAFLDEHKEYNIIHGHIGSTAAIYLSIAKKHGRYAIAHSHGLREPISLRTILYSIYSYRTRFVADYFFGCSKEALVSRYGKHISENKQKSKVLYNAINVKEFEYNTETRAKVRDELGISEEKIVLGTVGRMTQIKNPKMILDILHKLKDLNFDFHFLWVGDGELRQKIELDINNMNLTNDVTILGVRDDVSKLLQAIDIFVFPSIREGLGISAIEAQASGLPTLCSIYVPQEAEVTDLFKHIPIDNSEMWVQEILTVNVQNRTSRVVEVAQKGYDILVTSSWLQNFYIKKTGENYHG